MLLAPRRLRYRSCLEALAFACLGACTPFEPGTDELDETTVEQAALGTDWSCLSAETLPMLFTNPENSRRLVQTLNFVSLTSGMPLAGVMVRACPQRDVDCANPVTEYFTADAEGWADLPLYEGFDGYFEISGETIMSTLVFLNEPMRPDVQVDYPSVGVVEKALLPSLSGATGTMQDPELGLIYLRIFDCQWLPAAGATVSIDRPGKRWYFVDGLPSTSAVATAADSGLGGFLNVTPGVALVNVELPGSSRASIAPKSVIVRANWITGLRFVPRK